MRTGSPSRRCSATRSGLPIPHTAIIPAQKERLGRALGRFVATHVFTEAELRRTLGRIDLAGILHRFFADPKAVRPTAEALAGMLPRLLATVEDGRARRLIARLVPRILGGRGASAVVARALHGLLEGGRHQEVLSFILAQFRALLAAKEDQLRAVIAERVREQGGLLVGWALGAQVARRVLTTLNSELDKVGPDGSELRDAFDLWMRAEIARMETDPERAAEVGRRSARWWRTRRCRPGCGTSGPACAWPWRPMPPGPAATPSRSSRARWPISARCWSPTRRCAPGCRARPRAIVISVLPSAQASLSGFIGDVVANWDTATLVDRLELRVGKDLAIRAGERDGGRVPGGRRCCTPCCGPSSGSA